LAVHGKTIGDAVEFYLDYLERIRRCSVTVADLAKEVLEAKRKDGMSATYLADLKNVSLVSARTSESARLLK